MTRGRVLMAVLICALLVAGCAAATWFSAPVTTAGGTAVVTVSGFEAFPVLGALLLAIGAGSLALLMTAGVIARIVTVVLTLAALALGWAVVAAWGAAEDALSAAAAAATGVGEVAEAGSTTVWPALALAASVGLVVCVVALFTLKPQAARSARYERDARGTETPADQWDALSRGEDPSD